MPNDMALLFVLFNPMKSKRIIMNYLYITNIFKRQGLPVYTLELVFDGSEPEIMDAKHVRGGSHMFHKERLYRILETEVPLQFTKLAFLDCDIIFSNFSWYQSASDLLETFDAVQPFEKAHWQDLTYKKIILTKDTILKQYLPTCLFGKFHPGFAWCMRREWYNKFGFFDWGVIGSGDALTSAGWMKKYVPESFEQVVPAYRKQFWKFYNQPSPTMAFIPGMEIYHLHHGSRSKRQYISRHKLLNAPEDIETLIQINKDGVYEWVDKERFNPIFLGYFKHRDDDDLGDIIASESPSPSQAVLLTSKTGGS